MIVSKHLFSHITEGEGTMINTSNEWGNRKTRKVSVGIFKDRVCTILELQLNKLMPQEKKCGINSTTNLNIATSRDIQEWHYVFEGLFVS